MNTRRSSRNQERLWRALAGPPAPKPTPLPPETEAEELARLIRHGEKRHHARIATLRARLAARARVLAAGE